MKAGRVTAWALAVGIVAVTALEAAPAAARDPVLSKQQFDTIMSNLDSGGDLLVVANVDGLIENLVDGITQLISLAPENSPETRPVKDALAKLPAFLQKNGFYALQGFGLSVVPRADGMNTVKAFVSRDPKAADLPLWRCCVGGQPRHLRAMDFLPADTVLARSGSGELKEMWKMIRAGVTELATPQGAAMFNAGLVNLSTNAGVDVDAIFSSLGGEGFFSMQLSSTATVDIPSPGGQPVKMPQPSLLIGMAVKNEAMAKTIETFLSRKQVPVLKGDTDWGAVVSVNLPMPLPFPFQPCMAVYSNYFLLGSTPQVVQEAVQASRAKNGLASTPDFKRLFQGLPAVNNGIAYMSPRFMSAIVELQSAFAGQGGAPSAAPRILQEMIGTKADSEYGMVFLNTPNGVLSTGISSTGGREVVTSLVVAPIGLLAGIAIPSFVKARSASQDNACVNNLRQIDAAKEQWAMENKKSDGDPVDVAGVCKFLKGGVLPKCPQGGTYQLNAIGQPPTCSIPGHRLPDF